MAIMVTASAVPAYTAVRWFLLMGFLS